MQAWAIVRKAGYIPDTMSLEHHMFGMMLGKDGKPFKTRAGGTIRLADLLDEAIERAAHLIRQKIQLCQKRVTIDYPGGWYWCSKICRSIEKSYH